MGNMTETATSTARNLTDHPCFYGSAKARWGRVHLPVAPDCNIQCNFCNRLYDCANESRPAVTRGILEPGEVLDYLEPLLAQRKDISVIGIAGPGDPFCEPEHTLQTLHAVHDRYPDLLLCVSTNGLNAPDYVDDLADAGVTHVTVTVNAVDPQIGSRIYSHIVINGCTYRDTAAASLLIFRQKEAITRLKEHGLIVKVNTVVVPGINSDHSEAIAREVAKLGADIMNCIPMIPVADTLFESLKEPSEIFMAAIRHSASLFIPQMYHCQRCRADAAGLLCSSKEGGAQPYQLLNKEIIHDHSS